MVEGYASGGEGGDWISEGEAQDAGAGGGDDERRSEKRRKKQRRKRYVYPHPLIPPLD
jgi:hypothetical protein